MLIERKAVIEHWKKELPYEELAKIHCDLIESYNELENKMRERDLNVACLERENFTLRNVIDALTRDRYQNRLQ